MEQKYRLRKAILAEVSGGDEIEVTRLLIEAAFPEPSMYEHAVMLFAFSAQGKPPPPLSEEEQIARFCEVNGLVYRYGRSEQNSNWLSVFIKKEEMPVSESWQCPLCLSNQKRKAVNIAWAQHVVSGNMRPQSTTIIVSPYSRAIMLSSDPASPPRGTILSAPSVVAGAITKGPQAPLSSPLSASLSYSSVPFHRTAPNRIRVALIQTPLTSGRVHEEVSPFFFILLVPGTATGTMGTPLFFASMKAPLLNGRRAPVSDLVPSGKMTTETPLAILSAASSMLFTASAGLSRLWICTR